MTPFTQASEHDIAENNSLQQMSNTRQTRTTMMRPRPDSMPGSSSSLLYRAKAMTTTAASNSSIRRLQTHTARSDACKHSQLARSDACKHQHTQLDPTPANTNTHSSIRRLQTPTHTHSLIQELQTQAPKQDKCTAQSDACKHQHKLRIWYNEILFYHKETEFRY